MRNIIYLVVPLGAFLILAIPFFKERPKNSPATVIKIAEKVTLPISIANTPTLRDKGYSGHAPIGYNEGLLFVFERSAIYPFWMKEMLFDLDFILFEQNRVVEIFENVKAPVNNEGQMEYVNPTKPFRQLLEVKSGFVQKYQIKVGDPMVLED